ncbi:hypothetical protein CW304_27285 [Bacillus sp. UFRGS-B20]|nr:hypothetical protein CW304_27285 [Bacillus sp. UFRGS-B20]
MNNSYCLLLIDFEFLILSIDPNTLNFPVFYSIHATVLLNYGRPCRFIPSFLLVCTYLASSA